MAQETENRQARPIAGMVELPGNPQTVGQQGEESSGAPGPGVGPEPRPRELGPRTSN